MMYDVIFQNGNVEFKQHMTPPKAADNVLHISYKGIHIGTRTFIGSLYKHPEILSSKDPWTIYIHDIMEASDETLFNPGNLIMFGYELCQDMQSNWKAVILNAYDSENS